MKYAKYLLLLLDIKKSEYFFLLHPFIQYLILEKYRKAKRKL